MDDWNNDTIGKEQRMKLYRQLNFLQDNDAITKDNLNDRSITYLACKYNMNEDWVRSELLGEEWEGFGDINEDFDT